MKWQSGGDSGNVEDRRGMRMIPGGGFGRLGIGGMVVILILSLVFKQNFFALLGGGGTDTTASQSGSVASTPAEDSLKEFITFVLNDAQSAWARILPQQSNASYHDAHLVLFRDAIQSGCGAAESASGPFYCPADEKVYIDLGFYQELQERFGAPGDFAQAYVLAHEIGHHVQNILGAAGRTTTNDASVRLELQADCYAGIWAKSAGGEQRLEPGDIDEGLAAAAAVGDDRIQQMSGRAVNPETWTHGSAQQRAEWFRRGYDSGSLASCNTFR